MEALDRAIVAQAVKDAFDGKPLDFQEADCVRLAAFNLREMGHRVSLLKGLRWSSHEGALRAFKKAGFASLEEAVDALGFERIAPAKALPGDLVGLEGAGGLGCSLMVALGGGRLLGFLEGPEGIVAGVVQPKAFVCAWRVPCKRSR